MQTNDLCMGQTIYRREAFYRDDPRETRVRGSLITRKLEIHGAQSSRLVGKDYTNLLT